MVRLYATATPKNESSSQNYSPVTRRQTWGLVAWPKRAHRLEHSRCRCPLHDSVSRNEVHMLEDLTAGLGADGREPLHLQNKAVLSVYSSKF
ncbi:hypothetical protein E2C01_017231 [Portunus trituberculatus]|uniref:Uncharacterized protein n=1 Tax=Portunus trituberculatus TaxID=210409 RepID=A0A5B7DSB0_PORTR|nr:hypothetical protein [Portunus trituberculatus]